MSPHNTIPFKKIAAHPVFWMVCLSGLLRLVLALYQPPNPELWADAGTYHALADNMISGHGFSVDGQQPSRVRTPGYPAFIAVIYFFFGSSPKIAVVVQALICSLSVYVVYRLGQIVLDHRGAILSALLVSVHPALLYYDTRLLREGPTGLLLLLIALLAFRFSGRATKWHLLLIGSLLSAVSMIRPETLLMGLPAAYILFRPHFHVRQLWRPVLLVALPILLVWLPWTARNYTLFGSLSPITAGIGSTMWFGNQWIAIGGEDRKDADHAKLQEKTSRILNENITSGNEANVENTFSNMVLTDIMQRPGWFVAMIGKKMVLFWKDANGVKKTLPRIHPLLADVVNIYYYTLLGMMVFAIVRYRKNQNIQALTLWVFTYMMIYALLHVRNRYRVPVMPIVLLLSSGGICILWDVAKARFQKTQPAPQPVCVSAPQKNTQEPVVL